MTGSCDMEMDARNVNFALDLRSDNDGTSITLVYGHGHTAHGRGGGNYVPNHKFTNVDKSYSSNQHEQLVTC